MSKLVFRGFEIQIANTEHAPSVLRTLADQIERGDIPSGGIFTAPTKDCQPIFLGSCHILMTGIPQGDEVDLAVTEPDKVQVH